ncbi:beta-lactamase/D-alanine carboxypeptidase [compost metagenome]
MRNILFYVTATFFLNYSYSQNIEKFADSIRKIHNIPELNYAVISSEKIIEIKALGVKKINSELHAELSDRFRIGSNTKTITSYIAAVLVNEGKIKWDTRFFELFPELKAKSNPAYYGLTLWDLITFRAKIMKWSYGNEMPTKKEVFGTNQEQRYKLISWILQQEPVKEPQIIYWANPSYVAAGLMLEKATGKNYETLVKELGKELNIEFDFGQPNYKDQNQTWGHNEDLEPEMPADNFKLNWLSSAGNINVSLPDYAKFIQMQLKGLLGKSDKLSADQFNYMHYGLPEFAFGWEWMIEDESNLRYSFHNGNPGTFLTKVFICKDIDKAFIIFANVQCEEADLGMEAIFHKLNRIYSNNFHKS